MTTEEINKLNEEKRGTNNSLISVVDLIEKNGYTITDFSKFDDNKGNENNFKKKFSEALELESKMIDTNTYRQEIINVLDNIDTLLSKSSSYNSNNEITDGIKTPISTKVSAIKRKLGALPNMTSAETIKGNLLNIQKEIDGLTNDNTLSPSSKMNKYKELITKRNNQNNLLQQVNDITNHNDQKKADSFDYIADIEKNINDLISDLKNMNLTDEELKQIIDYNTLIKNTISKFREEISKQNNYTSSLSELGITKSGEIIAETLTQSSAVPEASTISSETPETAALSKPETGSSENLDTSEEFRIPEYQIFNKKTDSLSGSKNPNLNFGSLYKIVDVKVINGLTYYKVEGVDELINADAFSKVEGLSEEELKAKYEKPIAESSKSSEETVPEEPKPDDNDKVTASEVYPFDKQFLLKSSLPLLLIPFIPSVPVNIFIASVWAAAQIIKNNQKVNKGLKNVWNKFIINNRLEKKFEETLAKLDLRHNQEILNNITDIENGVKEEEIKEEEITNNPEVQTNTQKSFVDIVRENSQNNSDFDYQKIEEESIKYGIIDNNLSDEERHEKLANLMSDYQEYLSTTNTPEKGMSK